MVSIERHVLLLWGRAKKALAQKPGQLLSRDQMLEMVAYRQWNPSDRSIDVHIAKLRHKLHDHPRHPKLIKTVRGTGYMFAPQS
jgi:DNA-binding response OmpR family regulator